MSHLRSRLDLLRLTKDLLIPEKGLSGLRYTLMHGMGLFKPEMGLLKPEMGPVRPGMGPFRPKIGSFRPGIGPLGLTKCFFNSFFSFFLMIMAF